MKKYIGKGKLVRKGTSTGKKIGTGRFTRKTYPQKTRGSRYA